MINSVQSEPSSSSSEENNYISESNRRRKSEGGKWPKGNTKGHLGSKELSVRLLSPNVMGCFGGGTSTDQEEKKRRKEANKRINQQIQKDKQLYRATHRLLLLGNNHSFFLAQLT